LHSTERLAGLIAHRPNHVSEIASALPLLAIPRHHAVVLPAFNVVSKLFNAFVNAPAKIIAGDFRAFAVRNRMSTETNQIAIL
jgi:hypothetical protein